MNGAAAVLAISFLIVTASGCVMKSTYEAVLRETEVTKKEVATIRDEIQYLARDQRELEKLNGELMRNGQAAREEAQNILREVETQRRTGEEQQARLRQKIAQLKKQGTALRNEMAVSRENAMAMQELADVYRRKLQDFKSTSIDDPSSPMEVVQTPQSFDPAKRPPPETQPSPTVNPPQPSPPAPVSPVRPSPQPIQPPEQVESGWLSTFTDWLVSIWRSIFS